MGKVKVHQHNLRDISKFNEIYGGDFDKQDYKRQRKGGKQKFNHAKSQKRQRRHINKRMANQEYRKHNFDW